MSDYKPFRILSLDGGGVRGAYSAAFMAECEKSSGIAAWQAFDLIVGTSTGGIIALALGLGIPAEQVTEFYLNRAAAIFRRSNRPAWMKRLSALYKPIYELEDLRREARSIFGDKKIGDARTRLCVPTTNAVTTLPRVIKTSHHPDFRRDYKLPVVDVAVATAAAPIFFSGARIGNEAAFIDGGLWANNPALVGILEAHNYLDVEYDQIRLLSIGTGQSGGSIKEGAVLDSNLARWGFGRQLFSVVIDTNSNAVHDQVRIIEKTMGIQYDRFKPDGDHVAALDDVSSVRELASLGREHGRREFAKLHQRYWKDQVDRFDPFHK